MKSQFLKKKKLPDSPGVYLFKKGRTILYIGKATSLRDRVRSYFSNDLIKTRGVLLVDMVTGANDIDFIKTDSVLEALILEAELIKKHQPNFNTKEKDNKSYNFVVITKEDFPRIIIERGRSLSFDTKTYKKVFGPFPSKNQLEEALKIIRKIFPFLGEKKSSKLYEQLGLEPNIESGEAKSEYAKTIRNIILFFQGKKMDLIKKLSKEMKALAKEKDFESAGKIRNQIFALNHLRDVSLIKKDQISRTDSFRIESYDVAHMSGTNSVGVMTVVENGEVKKSDYRKFILRDTKKGDDVGGIEEILRRRLKHLEWPMADLIVVDGGIGQRNRAVQVLKEVGCNIPVVSVVKDDRHKPKAFLGPEKLVYKNKKDILISNSEAHRFAITFFRKKQREF